MSEHPTRAEINAYLWRRQFRTLLTGGILLAVVGLVFRMTGIQPDKVTFLLSTGTTLVVIAALGFGVMAWLRRRNTPKHPPRK